jgi:hypothetical protein
LRAAAIRWRATSRPQTRARPAVAQDHLQRRGLARAVSAQEAVDGSLGHGHRQVIDRQARAEATGKAFGLDGGGHRRRS